MSGPIENNEADKRLFTEKEVRSFPQFKDATPEEVENIIGILRYLALSMKINL